jgi:hypothetical protein
MEHIGSEVLDNYTSYFHENSYDLGLLENVQ